jgi:hypothetical protein
LFNYYRRLNACRPDIENSAFAHDFLDHFDWGAMAYRRHPNVPYIPNPNNCEESYFTDDNLPQLLGNKNDIYKGDQSLFKDF